MSLWLRPHPYRSALMCWWIPSGMPAPVWQNAALWQWGTFYSRRREQLKNVLPACLRWQHVAWDLRLRDKLAAAKQLFLACDGTGTVAPARDIKRTESSRTRRQICCQQRSDILTLMKSGAGGAAPLSRRAKSARQRSDFLSVTVDRHISVTDSVINHRRRHNPPRQKI